LGGYDVDENKKDMGWRMKTLEELQKISLERLWEIIDGEIGPSAGEEIEEEVIKVLKEAYDLGYKLGQSLNPMLED
jgi:hypothetical protein